MLRGYAPFGATTLPQWDEEGLVKAKKYTYLRAMKFTEILRERYHLSPQSIERLSAVAEQVDYDRRTLIVDEGQRHPYLYFVERGAVRCYVMREERAVMLSFAFEGDAASLAPPEHANGGSRCRIETLEPTRVVRFARPQLEELFAAHTELAEWGRRLVEQHLRIYEEYFADYAWMDKSEQYRYLLREYPQLLQRVPLKDLASYLYVTPQTLSRIRAEFARN